VDDTLKLTKSCWLEHTHGYGIELCYVEHSSDHWHSNMDTEIDIDRERAMEIIQWLAEKIGLPETISELKARIATLEEDAENAYRILDAVQGDAEDAYNH
jgi:hypothetical protein